MASKLFKRAVAREAVVQVLAFDKSPSARKARIAKVDSNQWRNREPRGKHENVCSGKAQRGTVVSYKHFWN